MVRSSGVRILKVNTVGTLAVCFNSFGAKFQTTFVVCFFYFNKLSLRKTYICEVDRLNVKQRRSR